ncbi:MAG: histidine kinase N-terminal 7TM domain-containing protein [Cyanobacteria bacterium P01_A01_bin.116]
MGVPVYFVSIAAAIAAAISSSVAMYAWQRREINGAKSFALCALSIFIWCLFSVFECLSPNDAARIAFARAQYFGIAPFAALWFVFTLRYAQADGWLRRESIVLLSAIPLATLILLFSEGAQRWIWHSVSVQHEPFPQLLIDHGWWFHYVLMPQCYLLLIAGFGVLLSACFTGSQLYRQQTLVLIVAGLIPFVCNVLYVVSGVTLYGLDLTPVGFAFGGLLVHLGFLRTRFLDIAPVSYRTAFLNTTDAVVLLDIHHRIVDLNPAALSEGRVPFALETVMGEQFDQVFPDYSALLRDLSKATELGIATELTQTVRLPRLFARRRSERLSEVFREVMVRSLVSPGGRRVGWIVMIRDVTLENQQREQLEQFAYVDSLTGLFNRRQLQIKAEELFAEPVETTGALDSTVIGPERGPGVSERLAKSTGSSSLTGTSPADSLDKPARFSVREAPPLPVALLYIDLNRFKPINDQYGHDVGDLVLQYFARCLNRSVRKGDMVVRLGGDEFAALLRNADRAVAYEVRSRLIKILSQATVIGGHRFTLSASIGIAYYPVDGQTLHDLLRHADIDMYQEKRQVSR